MKSKHFDSIIMDDPVTPMETPSKEHAKALERWFNSGGKKKSVILPRGHFKTTMVGVYNMIQTIWEDERDPLRQHVLDLFEEAEGVDLQAPQSQER